MLATSSGPIVNGSQPSPRRPMRSSTGSLLPPRRIGTDPRVGFGFEKTRSNCQWRPSKLAGESAQSVSDREHALLQPFAFARERRADHGVLLLLPPDSEAEEHPATRQGVERGDALRQDCWAVQRGEHHRGSQVRAASSSPPTNARNSSASGARAGGMPLHLARVGVRVARVVVLGDHDVLDAPDRLPHRSPRALRCSQHERAGVGEAREQRRGDAELDHDGQPASGTSWEPNEGST